MMKKFLLCVAAISAIITAYILYKYNTDYIKMPPRNPNADDDEYWDF